MITDSEVGDDCDIAFVKSKPFAQDATTRCFKDGCIHIGVHEHIASAARTAAVSGVDAAMFDIDAIGVGHADAFAACFQQVRG